MSAPNDQAALPEGITALLLERLRAVAVNAGGDYARGYVTPLYGPDSSPTPSERWQLRQVTQHWTNGYMRALDELAAALRPVGDPKEKQDE